jgi:hypothetical protein
MAVLLVMVTVVPPLVPLLLVMLVVRVLAVRRSELLVPVLAVPTPDDVAGTGGARAEEAEEPVLGGAS